MTHAALQAKINNQPYDKCPEFLKENTRVNHFIANEHRILECLYLKGAFFQPVTISMGLIAHELGISRRTVLNNLKRLTDNGFLEVISQYKTMSSYYIKKTPEMMQLIEGINPGIKHTVNSHVKKLHTYHDLHDLEDLKNRSVGEEPVVHEPRRPEPEPEEPPYNPWNPHTEHVPPVDVPEVDIHLPNLGISIKAPWEIAEEFNRSSKRDDIDPLKIEEVAFQSSLGHPDLSPRHRFRAGLRLVVNNEWTRPRQLGAVLRKGGIVGPDHLAIAEHERVLKIVRDRTTEVVDAGNWTDDVRNNMILERHKHVLQGDMHKVEQITESLATADHQKRTLALATKNGVLFYTKENFDKGKFLKSLVKNIECTDADQTQSLLDEVSKWGLPKND